ATVRGDVHDIGKNLVDIILTNNGYTVHNIGIKIPINEIVAKYHETKPDAIGLSGLLVKSVNVMEENLKELNNLGITVPMILGGAALQRSYCEGHLRDTYHGKTYHGTDAFEGLRLMDYVCNNRFDELEAEIEERKTKRVVKEEKVAELQARTDERKAAELKASGGVAVAMAARSDTPILDDVPTPPFYGSRVVEDLDLDQIYPFINETALFKTQWQFTRGSKDSADYERQLEEEVRPILDRYKRDMKAGNILQGKVVYGFWPCNADGDDLVIYDPVDHDKEIECFTNFPRQHERKRLCISDFFLPVDSGKKDVLPLQCVTMGQEISRVAKTYFDADNYTEYLYAHGMGVECAEALAELWHKRIRAELGIGNDDSPKIKQLFSQKYRGSRYSFGYPSCPEMQDQEILFRLLEPERIGCELTENWQIDPEQSTSAIVVHHPDAKYFNL
ncbi:MAG: vitamin B12 dependent-methionine synthase activation domain-containing protein, partial [Planctomycetota bacterium]